MNVQITKVNDFTVIVVNGRLDTITASEFEAQLIPLVEPGSKLVIDCSGLDYISSTGLRVFLLTQKKIQTSGGKLNLCHLNPPIQEIFDIAGFSNIFSIFPDQTSATSN